MRLSQEELEMLDGKMGVAAKKAMELLVAVGETYRAEKLIKISYAHIVAPDLLLWTTGQLGQWAWELANESLCDLKRFRVDCTIDPLIFDPGLLRRLNYPVEQANEMEASLSRSKRLWEGLGILPVYTCTPFFVVPPRWGEHIATAETSVQLFCNSVIGAMTNRETVTTALASAITGRTPYYGMHLPENRAGKVLVRLKDNLNPLDFTDADYSVLGDYVSRQCVGDIPVYTGIPGNISITDLFWLASAHSVGSLAMCHVAGVTPEAPDIETAFRGKRPLRTVEVGKEEIEATYREVCSATTEDIDWVLLGCPHATLAQVKQIASLLFEKHVKPDVKLIVATSQAIYDVAVRMGAVDIIRNAGGVVAPEICATQVFQRDVPAGFRIGTVATNWVRSGGLYKVEGVKVWVGGTEKCVKAAITGRWER